MPVLLLDDDAEAVEVEVQAMTFEQAAFGRIFEKEVPNATRMVGASSVTDFDLERQVATDVNPIVRTTWARAKVDSAIVPSNLVHQAANVARPS